MKFHITLKSANAKTGPIPVTTSARDTCSPSCPFMKNGCYADSGPLALHWDKVTRGERGVSFDELCAIIAKLPDGQLWRHNQAGDLPGIGDAISDEIVPLVAANAGRKGFTYTHKPVIGDSAMIIRNRANVRVANERGFTINLSANSLAHADELAALKIAPVVVVLPADATSNCVTPKGRKVVVCPATQRDDVSCATCKLCANASATRPIIGFPAHGSGAKKASAVSITFHKGA